MSMACVLAVVPARGGSKGLPGKNTRPLAGLPLIAHSIACAQLAPEIADCIVSTDSPEIAQVAMAHGGDVPFLRPAELAQDTTPMLPVLQHALREMEARRGRRYDLFLLLQPTGPLRLPEDISRALEMMEADPTADGVVAVSDPGFNPRYVCVEERNGYLADAFPTGQSYTRRQQVPPVYRVNGMVYLYRRDYLAEAADLWAQDARIRMLVVPRERAIDIDYEHDFELAELLLRGGLVRLPWLAAGAQSIAQNTAGQR